MNFRSVRFRLIAWYSGLLAASLLLSVLLFYLGLREYLFLNLETSLREQARSIADRVLIDADRKGDAYVVDEANDYAPEINNRFLRVSRQDGSIVYVSGTPHDASFDPAKIPVISTAKASNSPTRRWKGAREILIESVVYTAPGGRTYLVEAGSSIVPIVNILHGLLLISAAAIPMFLGLALAGGYIVMQYALAPVQMISDRAEQISSRNFGERLPIINSGDELERLSISLNRMISRLEESFQHVSRFSGDVSHELRTPLTILRGELDAMARERSSPQMLDMIGSALEETQRMSDIVEALLAIARIDAGQSFVDLQRIDLHMLVVSTAEQMRLLADEKSITIRYEARQRPEVLADPAQLRQIVVNLLSNATMYTPSGGRIELVTFVSGGHAVLTVSDNGVGISSDALPHIFDRFYRADNSRSRVSGGTGLGLAIVKAICTAHGGTVTVASKEGNGSTFRVELPLFMPETRSTAPEPASMSKAGRGPDA